MAEREEHDEPALHSEVEALRERVAALEARVTELEKDGQLLKECGSFPPAGKKDELGLWDLAGNVAEWAVTEDGKGKVLGFSAVSPTDKRCEYTPPTLGYVGFRVIAEE